MWEEDELPDDDLRSVYGEAAFYLRLCAKIEALEQKDLVTTRKLAVIAQRAEPPAKPHENSP